MQFADIDIKRRPQTAPRAFARLIPALVLAGILFAVLYSTGMMVVVGIGLMLLALFGVLVVPEAATLLVIFVLYTDAAAVAVRSYGMPSELAIGFFLLLFFPALNYIFVRREEIRVDRTLAWMLVYFSIGVASALTSRRPDQSLDALTRFVLEGVCIYFLVLNTLRSRTTLRRVAYVLILAAAFLGTLSIVQAITSTYNRSYGGFALPKVIQQDGVYESVLDTGQRDENDRPVDRNRALGPFGDPNYYGQMMAAALPFAAVLALKGRSRKVRVICLIACAPILGAIMLTYSRGAALSVVLLLLFLVKLKSLRLRYALLVIPVLAILVGTVPAYRDRLDTLSVLGSGMSRQTDVSVWERTTVLRAGVRVFMGHPLLGIGFGQSAKFISGFANANGFDTLPADLAAHNTYLQQLVETGVLGFTAFVALAFATLRNLFRVRRYWLDRNEEFAHELSAIGLAVLMFLATSVFLHLSFLRYYSLLLGIAGAAAIVYRPDLASDNVAAASVEADPGSDGFVPAHSFNTSDL